MRKKKVNKNPVKNLVAGGLSGAIEATIMFPTEYVKTQLQLAERAADSGVKPYKGPVDCARRIVAERGFLSLYRGLSTLVIGSIPKAGVRFMAFEKFKGILTGPDSPLSPGMQAAGLGTLFAGLGAGVSEAIIAVTPMETLKTKFIHDQNQPKPQYNGLVHGVKTIVAKEGLGGVYKGLVPTMMKQGTNQAVRFTVFGRVKSLFNVGAPGESAFFAFAKAFTAGAVAGGISVYATMPFDVVKTKMQGLDAAKYGGTWNCFTSILKNDGVLALWKGTTPRLFRVCFSSAIILSVYEQISAGLDVLFPEEDVE